MTNHFTELVDKFFQSPPDIHNQIINYANYIEEKTRSFVGRGFVFDAIFHFIEHNPRGYYFIRGDPGIGKSAIAAQLVKNNGYVHHFNIRHEGINNAESFLRNVCAQLISAYDLDYSILPTLTTQSNDFLNKLLHEISNKLLADEKLVIVIDALDEVDDPTLPQGVNTLYLPTTLPDAVYILITMRRVNFNLYIACEQATLNLETDTANNMADVCAYIEQMAKLPGIQAYFQRQGIDKESFVTELLAKSQGNFMFLAYLLPEIERGVYKDLRSEYIPSGLQNYYEDHWQRLQRQDEEAWFRYKLPVIMTLTVVRRPVSVDLIADFLGIKRPHIRTVLNELSQFLYEEEIKYQDGSQKRYRIYHNTFRDFVASKEEIVYERVDYKEIHKRIADALWHELSGGMTIRKFLSFV